MNHEQQNTCPKDVSSNDAARSGSTGLPSLINQGNAAPVISSRQPVTLPHPTSPTATGYSTLPPSGHAGNPVIRPKFPSAFYPPPTTLSAGTTPPQSLALPGGVSRLPAALSSNPYARSSVPMTNGGISAAVPPGFRPSINAMTPQQRQQFMLWYHHQQQQQQKGHHSLEPGMIPSSTSGGAPSQLAIQQRKLYAQTQALLRVPTGVSGIRPGPSAPLSDTNTPLANKPLAPAKKSPPALSAPAKKIQKTGNAATTAIAVSTAMQKEARLRAHAEQIQSRMRTAVDADLQAITSPPQMDQEFTTIQGLVEALLPYHLVHYSLEDEESGVTFSNEDMDNAVLDRAKQAMLTFEQLEGVRRDAKCWSF